MIRITNPEYIDGKDSFKIDGLHVKRFSLEFPTNEQSKQTLVIEAVPFAYLDSGKRVYNKDKVYKIVVSDCEAFMGSAPASFIPAYFATEQAIRDIMAQDYPLLQLVWEAPSA